LIKLETTNRFWLFAHQAYEPFGGMSDFQASFSAVGEAIEWVKTDRLHDNYSLYDTQERLRMKLTGEGEGKDNLEFIYYDGQF
jgi:hypothetical protein